MIRNTSQPTPPQHLIGGSADPRKSERGFTTFAVLALFVILMGIAAIFSTTVVSTAKAERRDDDKQNEYWLANSNAETMEAALVHDLPVTYDQDVRAAKDLAGLRPLPAFDSSSTAQPSRPLYQNGQQLYPANQATSLLGTVDAYAQSKVEAIQNHAVTLGVVQGTAVIAQINEATRREVNGPNNVGRSEAYVLKYQIHANYGLGGRIQPSGTIQLGNTGAGCTSVVNASANPTIIRRGQSSTLRIDYASTDAIEVKSGNQSIYSQNTTFTDTTQRLSVPVTPNVTTTYTATGTVGNCSANSAPVVVEVQWNDAAFISQSVPNTINASLPGTPNVVPVSITMRNTGTTTWFPNTYSLGTNIPTWGVTRVPVPRNVAPGDVVTFNFNITAPPQCPSNENFQWQMIEHGVEWFGEVTPNQPIAVTCPPPVYEGVLENANCSTISGWVYDRLRPNNAITIKVFLDGNFYGQISANQYRADLQAAGKGNGVHGFSLPTPPANLQDGYPHQISVRTADDAFALSNSPLSITCGPRYEGALEIADCNQIAGWGWDRNQPNSTINISVFSDGNLISATPANIFRADLLSMGIGNGNHGFNIVTPNTLHDGKNHLITATDNTTNTSLPGSPKTINCPPPPDPCPTVQLMANGQKGLTVVPHESFTLNWTSTNASDLSIDNGIGTVATPTGSRALSFPTDGIYTINITALNADRSCSKQDSVTITVRTPLPNLSVTLNVNDGKTATMLTNQPATLSWTSISAAELIIDNGIGSVTAPSGSTPIQFASPGAYRVTLTGYTTGRANTAQDYVDISVVARPSCATVQLTANGAKSITVHENDPFTLAWSSTNAFTLAMDNGIGPADIPGGTRTVRFPTQGSYRITINATNSDNSCNAQDFVEITVTPIPPAVCPTVTLNITDSPTPGRIRLNYNSTNASALSIDQGVGAVPLPSGSVEINRPASATTYTITATPSDARCTPAQATATSTLQANPRNYTGKTINYSLVHQSASWSPAAGGYCVVSSDFTVSTPPSLPITDNLDGTLSTTAPPPPDPTIYDHAKWGLFDVPTGTSLTAGTSNNSTNWTATFPTLGKDPSTLKLSIDAQFSNLATGGDANSCHGDSWVYSQQITLGPTCTGYEDTNITWNPSPTNANQTTTFTVTNPLASRIRIYTLGSGSLLSDTYGTTTSYTFTTSTNPDADSHTIVITPSSPGCPEVTMNIVRPGVYY